MAFPTTLPTYTTSDPAKTLDQDNHTQRHNDVQDDVVAIATKVGINNSADVNSLDYKVANMIQIIYPVGSLYVSTLATNPATLLGFGTWTAFGAGRVMVGFDSGQTEFDTVEETGGSKTHTLTEAEMPSHTHIQNSHVHLQRGAGAGGAVTTATYAVNNVTESNQVNTAAATATNQNTGGGGAHNNLQPYIVVRMWKRTA